MNRIDDETERQVRTLIEAGLSTRAIALLTKVHRDTICRRRAALIRHNLHEPMCGNKRVQCHYCGKPVGEKEFQRRTARTKHQFCDSECYQSYYLVTDAERLARHLERMVNHA